MHESDKGSCRLCKAAGRCALSGPIPCIQGTYPASKEQLLMQSQKLLLKSTCYIPTGMVNTYPQMPASWRSNGEASLAW